MNILVIGSGGREHAITWKIKQSEKCSEVFVAPGNAGTAQIAQNINIAVTDFPAIEEFVIQNNVELVIVGPEEPLVKGIVNYFQKTEALQGVKIIGPDSDGAQLEGSKDFSKIFMEKNNIPTAAYKTFTKENIEESFAYIKSMQVPVVLKADGLAAGKGVIIAQSHEEAISTIKDMLVDLKFGEASAKVVIEEFLQGIELSVFVLTDGDNYIVLPEAKDYKRIGEGDTGLNTGGMGALSPVPFASQEFLNKVDERVIQPTIQGLKNDNIKYKGFIFIGLMNMNGDPYVIEYNVRMGDPETEVVFPRIKSDVLEMFDAVGQNKLDEYQLEIDDQAASTIVLVSGGYPEAYDKGNIIEGLDSSSDQVTVFHAGTKNDGDKILTNGGRVLALTGKGKDLAEALAKSNQAAEKISWKGKYYRTDIGFDIL